jgi:hypothetical protein
MNKNMQLKQKIKMKYLTPYISSDISNLWDNKSLINGNTFLCILIDNYHAHFPILITISNSMYIKYAKHTKLKKIYIEKDNSYYNMRSNYILIKCDFNYHFFFLKNEIIINNVM